VSHCPKNDMRMKLIRLKGCGKHEVTIGWKIPSEWPLLFFFIWSRAPQKWHQNGKIKCVLIANLVFPKHATVCISQQADGRARRKKSEKNIGCTQGGIRRELLKALYSLWAKGILQNAAAAGLHSARCWIKTSTRESIYIWNIRESGFKENTACWCVIMTWTLEIKRPTSDRGSDK